MKALTIQQPYASLLACGAKIYETRSRATKYRGTIAIHAALIKPSKLPIWTNFDDEFTKAAVIALKIDIKQHKYIFTCFDDLPCGMVIATAELVGCYSIVADDLCKTRLLCEKNRDTPYNEISEKDNEFIFGNWKPGRYAWEIKNMIMLPEPIPAKGQQGLWELK